MEEYMAAQNGVKVQGIVHWAIPVNDLEESRRFYTEVLGMEDRGPVGPLMRCVRFGDTDILLSVRPQPLPVDVNRDGPTHISFRVSTEDFERAVAHMREWGVEVKPEFGSRDHLKGDVEYRHQGVFVGRSLYFIDPSGNRLEVFDSYFPPES
jgi:catechol 2,3-dioxygenase-like lactoylglutathione lyase family enzyme